MPIGSKKKKKKKSAGTIQLQLQRCSAVRLLCVYSRPAVFFRVAAAAANSVRWPISAAIRTCQEKAR